MFPAVFFGGGGRAPGTGLGGVLSAGGCWLVVFPAVFFGGGRAPAGTGLGGVLSGGGCWMVKNWTSCGVVLNITVDGRTNTTRRIEDREASNSGGGRVIS